MHVATLLAGEMFEVEIEGRPASIAEALPEWNPHDRFGLVIDESLGGVGATHLLQIAITSFYDVKPSRRRELKIYPEIYAFHIGKGHGAHAPYDFWPARREVMLSTDPREILDAINDRGITRLAVPDRAPRDIQHRPKEEDAALDRIVSAFAYHPSGRVSNADIRIAGKDKRTEYNPGRVLRPVYAATPRPAAAAPKRLVKETDPSYVNWLRERDNDVTEEERAIAERRRESLKQDGVVTESYRRIAVSEALKRLASTD